jgi:hypothetical protein
MRVGKVAKHKSRSSDNRWLMSRSVARHGQTCDSLPVEMASFSAAFQRAD